MTVYTDYQFNDGTDYSNLAGPDAAIPGMPAQLLPSDANIGAVSAEVGTGVQDAMIGLDSNGLPYYNDTTDNRQFTHPDSLSGIAGQAQEEVLQNQEMYGDSVTLPFQFPPSDTADELLQGEN